MNTAMLQIKENLITYQLSWLEKIGAFGNSPTAKLSNLSSITKEENPWSSKVLRGIRFPGTGFPYLIMLGTMRHRKGKDFTVVYKRRAVLVLEFENEDFKRWVIPATEANQAVLKSLSGR